MNAASRFAATGGLTIACFAAVPPEPGGPDRLVAGSIRDITENERREEPLRRSQKMEAVGQLIGGIAHGFNNLLTGISGALELVSARLGRERHEAVGRHVAIAQEAADCAASLTRCLPAFSRRRILDPPVVALPAVVEGMMPPNRRSMVRASR